MGAYKEKGPAVGGRASGGVAVISDGGGQSVFCSHPAPRDCGGTQGSGRVRVVRSHRGGIRRGQGRPWRQRLPSRTATGHPHRRRSRRATGRQRCGVQLHLEAVLVRVATERHVSRVASMVPRLDSLVSRKEKADDFGGLCNRWFLPRFGVAGSAFTDRSGPAQPWREGKRDAPGPGSLGNAGTVTTAGSERSGLAVGPCADGNRRTGAARWKR